MIMVFINLNSGSFCAGLMAFYKLIIILSCALWLCNAHAVGVDSTSHAMTCTQEYTLHSDVINDLPVLDFFQQFQNDIEHDKAQVIAKEPKRCLVSQKDLKKIKQRVLVDVRPKKTFDKGAMAGSINLPEHHLSTRSFLKNKAVVLVGDSYRYLELYDYCNTLKQRGFRSVYVLDGGYTMSASSGIQSISVKQFFDAKRKHVWLVIMFSDQELADDSLQENNNLVVINPSMEREKILQKISERFLALNTLYGVQANVLLVSALGENRKEFLHYVSTELRDYTYVLEGGLDAYNTFAQKNTAMINNKRQLAGFQHYGCGG